jgi:hypothetical protein
MGLLGATIILFQNLQDYLKLQNDPIIEIAVLQNKLFKLRVVVPPQIKKSSRETPLFKTGRNNQKITINNPTIVKAPLATPDIAITMESSYQNPVTLHQLLDLTLAAAENGTGNNKAN